MNAPLATAPPVDGLLLRTALGRFATGVAVVTTCDGDQLQGVTVNSVASVSLDPPILLWSLRSEAPSLDGFRRAGQFVVNILANGQRAIADRFARRAPDKFDGVTFARGFGGCPVLPGSIARFDCRVEREVPAGDHVIFLGAIESFEVAEGVPLIFSSGRYCTPRMLIENEGNY